MPVDRTCLSSSDSLLTKIFVSISWLFHQEPRQKGSNLKRRGMESDEDSPPRKMPAHRRMAVVYDSDEE